MAGQQRRAIYFTMMGVRYELVWQGDWTFKRREMHG